MKIAGVTKIGQPIFSGLVYALEYLSQNAQSVGVKVAVIGLGRVGLPLALVMADEGCQVIGVDIDKKKIKAISQGILPFLEEGVLALLERNLNKDFTLGTNDQLSSCDAVFITVGTLLSDKLLPDHSAVVEVVEDIAPRLKDGSLIVLRSTVEPKTTRKIFKLIKKKTTKDIHLVYAPERIAEGFAVKELYELPQIIGSFDDISFDKASEIFSLFVSQVIKTDPLTAELAKLTLNTYRYARFALANELMMIANHHGKDIYDVLKIANKDYIRGGIPSPGFAAGPCLVKDSFFIRHNTPYNDVIYGSYLINDRLPEYIVSELNKRTKLKNQKIALLGLTFKKNVDDTRGSLSMKLYDLLEKKSKSVSVHDPYVAKGELKKVLKNADVIIISVNHDEYTNLTSEGIKHMVGNKVLICDMWNVLGKGQIFFDL